MAVLNKLKLRLRALFFKSKLEPDDNLTLVVDSK
jgi:hypothetical protein